MLHRRVAEGPRKIGGGGGAGGARPAPSARELSIAPPATPPTAATPTTAATANLRPGLIVSLLCSLASIGAEHELGSRTGMSPLGRHLRTAIEAEWPTKAQQVSRFV